MSNTALLILASIIATSVLPLRASAISSGAFHCPTRDLASMKSSSKSYPVRGLRTYGKEKAGRYACASRAELLGARPAGVKDPVTQTLRDGSRDTASLGMIHGHHQSHSELRSLPTASLINPPTHDRLSKNVHPVLSNGDSYSYWVFGLRK